MEGGSALEYYLEKAAPLVYVIGLTIVLIALEGRLYTHAVIERINVSSGNAKYIDALMNARIIGGSLFIIIYLNLLVGGFIRAIVRLIDPENPLTLRVSISISSIAALLYYIFRFILSDVTIFLVEPVKVDMSSVNTENDFANALIEGFNARQAAHPTAKYFIIAFQYLGVIFYLGIIRYFLYKVRDARVATYTTVFILVLLLVGAL